MKHSDVEEKHILERYLRNELSGSEEDGFEKHLITCRQCREDIEQMETVIAGIRKMESDRVFKGSYENRNAFRVPGKSLPIIKRAAGILVVIGFAGMIYLAGIKHIRTMKQVVTQNGTGNDSATFNSTVQKPSDVPELENIDGRENEKLIAARFKPDPFYERLVRNVYRGENFQVLEPRNDTISGSPVFNWKYHAADSLKLLIITNTGTKIVERTVARPYTLPEKLDKGLYYWQLQSETETLITRRMIVR